MPQEVERVQDNETTSPAEESGGTSLVPELQCWPVVPGRFDRTQAAHLINLGFALVPLRRGHKRPLRRGWQYREALITTLGDLEREFGHGAVNYGVQLEASGLMSLDIDQLELSRALFAERGLDLDAIMAAHPCAVQARGTRLWFRTEELGAQRSLLTGVRSARQGRRVAFEVRCGPGAQDVAPGSWHPDGLPYRWSVTPASRERLPLAPPWLIDLYVFLADQATLDPGESAPLWQPAAEPAVPKMPALPARPKMPARSVPAHRRARASTAEGAASAAVQPAIPLPPVTLVHRGEALGRLIDCYCEHHRPEELLSQAGYRQIGERWLSPSSTSGLPGVVIFDGERPRAYSHHASDGWQGAEDAFGLLRELHCGGDLRQAARLASARLSAMGIEHGGFAPLLTERAEVAMAAWRAGLDGVIERLAQASPRFGLHGNQVTALIHLATQLGGMAGDQLREARGELELQIGTAKTLAALVGGHHTSVSARLQGLHDLGFIRWVLRDERDPTKGRAVLMVDDPATLRWDGDAPLGLTVATRGARRKVKRDAARTELARTELACTELVSGSEPDSPAADQSLLPPNPQKGIRGDTLVSAAPPSCLPVAPERRALQARLRAAAQGAELTGLRETWIDARLAQAEQIRSALLSALSAQRLWLRAQLLRPLASARRLGLQQALARLERRVQRLIDGESPWAALVPEALLG